MTTDPECRDCGHTLSAHYATESRTGCACGCSGFLRDGTRFPRLREPGPTERAELAARVLRWKLGEVEEWLRLAAGSLHEGNVPEIRGFLHRLANELATGDPRLLRHRWGAWLPRGRRPRKKSP